jgi:D-amino peptidase
MADVNAAVDGAFLGGADHVTVLDSHGGGGNFDLALLDKRAENDVKANKKWWGMLDESYFGSFFIGAHAMAGTLRAFLDHTQSSISIYNYIVNGRYIGELGQWAMVCGHFGVPVIMASGDEAAVNEAAQFFGGIETAAVKRALSRSSARLIPNGEAEDKIRLAAKTAVEKTEASKPFRPLLPMEIKFEFTRSDYCDEAVNKSGLERIGARTARKIAESYLDFWI